MTRSCLRLRKESREIQSVEMMGNYGSSWRVGRDNVTKIAPYGEPGQGAEVPWLAVYKGDDVAFRINCAAVEYIGY